MPLGPKVVFSTSPITCAAIMLFLWASLPLLRVVPSLRINTGCPEPVVVKYAISITYFIRTLFNSEISKKRTEI
jgi:hypothetical protein